MPPSLGGTCGDPAARISSVQGPGDTSPLEGQPVTIEAIVTASFQESSLGGFFLQEETRDEDGDPQTSEGIFVYHTADPVAVGARVRVTGTIKEFHGLTEVVRIKNVTICPPAQRDQDQGSSVTPITALLPIPSGQPRNVYLEAREGMLSNLLAPLTVTDNHDLARYGTLGLSEGGRLLQPTQVVLPGPRQPQWPTRTPEGSSFWMMAPTGEIRAPFRF